LQPATLVPSDHSGYQGEKGWCSGLRYDRLILRAGNVSNYARPAQSQDETFSLVRVSRLMR